MATNNLFRNKKGDKLLSMYWFVILMIVAGGIVGMVYVFYGNPYDVRDIEANLLGDKIADCISYAGRINENLISYGKSVNPNFLKSCHLNFGPEENEFFYEVTFYKVADMSNPFLDYFLKLNGGNLNLAAGCEIQEKSENLPKCTENSFYSLDNSDNQYIIKILTAVKKTEQNA
jgi:hypothetical protein